VSQNENPIASAFDDFMRSFEAFKRENNTRFEGLERTERVTDLERDNQRMREVLEEASRAYSMAASKASGSELRAALLDCAARIDAALHPLTEDK